MYKRKHEVGIQDNKSMIIKDIHGIEIDNFRQLENQVFSLSKNVTIVSGRNGTMKSTIMGLVAQPFRTTKKNIFGHLMHTKFSEVFNLSTKTDVEKYNYNIKMEINEDLLIKEPIPVYLDSTGERHRLVPSGSSKGDGFFNLPSVYLNLKRLFPLVEMGEAISNMVEYSKEERKDIARLFEVVLLKEEFSSFESYDVVNGKVKKNPIGPKNATYDINSISSGEDNLGTLAQVLISFQRVYHENKKMKLDSLTGILSIDEFEASLHPVSQYNLLIYLINWSQKYKVKIILNTHSLYLIERIMRDEDYFNHNRVKLNFITNRGQKKNKLIIIENPTYELALEELTLLPEEQNINLMKVKLLCEDDEAMRYIKNIIGNKIAKHCEFIHNVKEDETGTGYNLLTDLARKYPVFLKESKAIIVVDSDVEEEKIKNTNNKFCMRIPSIGLNSLPIEKELVTFILSLDNDNDFFIKAGKTREMFRNEFSQCGIALNPKDINAQKTSNYKKWFKTNNKREINKYRRYMIKSNKSKYIDFSLELIDNINEILVSSGFPKIEGT